jgi:hypothetical protein
LVTALYHLFETIPTVKKAYVAQIFDPERDKNAHPIIAIETIGDWEKLGASIGIVLSGLKLPDPVDSIPMTGKGGLESYFLKNCKPFYESEQGELNI